MDKSYDPSQIENAIYTAWEKTKLFEPKGKGTPYCIVLPPPNVTGTLHMGHGFQHTLMDALIRYHRMKGDNTLWQGGTDHAGIATQMVVERQLLAKNQTRHDLGREKFIKRIWQWKETSGNTITKQMRRLGDSIDWSRERFTMDEQLSKAVQKAFIDLYEDGLIYRGKRLVNWDPILHTAISDLEVVSEEEQGKLWYIRYPFTQGKGHILIATTRPETMLGDVAVAVNPEDKRFKKYIGKTVRLPLVNREIPIIADDYVDKEFGTGCVKITPAHDFNDYQIGLRHKLPMINILTADAKINQEAPKAYQNLDRFKAREKIVADLTAEGLLEKTESHTLKVPRGDRSHTIIEPWLTDQWFVKTKPLAKPAIDAMKKGKTKFIPENWENTYFQWMNNIEDWCISRQLWWGHRIPAWYDESGNVYVGENIAQIRKKHQLKPSVKLAQDEDVLDTWFSSSLWPFSTLGWPDKTKALKTFYPTNVLVTGFDIIFFWVARMMMMGLYFMKEVPFKEIYITGLIRDTEGQKMSKSKGNILDPIDLIDGISLPDLLTKRTQGLMQPHMKQSIEEATQKQFPDGIAQHGTDALRMTFCSLASPSRDICFDLGRLEGYRNFCNKLWNATRFVLMQTDNQSIGKSDKDRELSQTDQWILSRLQHTIESAHKHFKEYRFDLLTQTLYDFTWYEFCDWYLELAKITLANSSLSKKQSQGTRHTLLSVLESLLCLLHPCMPFITEHLWQSIAKPLNRKAKTIMVLSYPKVNKKLHAPKLEADIAWLQQVVMAIRNLRSQKNVPPSRKISVLIESSQKPILARFKQYQKEIMALAKLEAFEITKQSPAATEAITTLVEETKLHILLADLVDPDEEKARLQKEIAKIEGDLTRTLNKLNHAEFMSRAPAHIVEQEKIRKADFEKQLQTLKEQLKKYEKNT